MDFKSLGGFEKILEFEEIWIKSHLYGWDLKKGKKIWIGFFLNFRVLEII